MKKIKTSKKKEVQLPSKCGVKDLARVYAAEHDVPITQAEEAIRNTIDVICNALSTGHDVSFPGTLTFKAKTRAARTGRNPKTNEPMEIPATKTVSLKVGATLKAALNK